MKNGRLMAVFVSVGLLAMGFASLAQAVDVPITSYTFNFSGASGGAVPNLAGVHDSQFLASSILGFHDLDASGGISTGDTFQDYTVFRIRTFTNASGDDITPAGYGSTHQITVKAAFSGVQLTDNTYAVTAIELAEVYFDAGATFTTASFADLNTFQDGLLVETMSGPARPSGGNNSGPQEPNGTIDIIAEVADNLHNLVAGEFFELTDAGVPLELVPSFQSILADFDADNDATPPAVVLGGLNGTERPELNPAGGFADVFAAFGLAGTQAADGTIITLSDNNGAFDFGFSTRSDGSFVKAAVVPEPSTLLLLGGGLIVSCVWRRRRMA
jgi:hypothetical protein